MSGIPSIDGLLAAHDVAATAASIARMQEPDGAVPWTTGGHTDTWNHVEAAMALPGGREYPKDCAWHIDSLRVIRYARPDSTHSLPVSSTNRARHGATA